MVPKNIAIVVGTIVGAVWAGTIFGEAGAFFVAVCGLMLLIGTFIDRETEPAIIVIIGGLLVGFYSPLRLGWDCYLVIVPCAALISGMFIPKPAPPDLRAEPLCAVASKLGLFYEGAAPAVLGSWEFAPLSRGDQHQASHIMSGKLKGYRTLACDYSYWSAGGGNNKVEHKLSAVIVYTDCGFPKLTIRPETTADKVAAEAGLEDIDFESQEFSDKYYVQCPNRKFAYGLVTAEVMAYLLDNPGWSIDLGKLGAMIYSDRQWEPDEFPRAVTILHGFLDRIPHYIWKELGSERALGPGAAPVAPAGA